VVVGAGFGGLAVVKALRRAPVDIELVDANNFHLFQPLLYQVATAGLDSDDVAYAVRGIFRRQGNVTVHMARVVGIDVDAKTLTLDRGVAGPRSSGVEPGFGTPAPPGASAAASDDDTRDEMSYDSLVIAAGAVATTFGIDGVDEHAIPLKDLDDALDMRLAVLERFERAATDPAMIERGEVNVVVCGGGPSGVEMAGALIELYTKVLAKDFPALDVRSARVILVEAADRLLLAMSPKTGERARRTLSRRGVEVKLGAGVERVTADGQQYGVHLSDGTVVPAGVVVWTAGVRAHPLAESLGTELTKGGRIVVNADLTVPGHPDVFAIGDIAAMPANPVAGEESSAMLPQVAQPAIQGGRHAGRQIIRQLEGRATEPFRYHDKGTMATIGRADAVTELPNGVRLSGFPGWLAWLGLHLVYLIGFRNRLNVLVNWAWNYVTYDRHSRIVASRDAERARSRRP
jgi:NADH:ubiquinone reductase (H+-translocating)